MSNSQCSRISLFCGKKAVFCGMDDKRAEPLQQKLFIAPSNLLPAQPEVPSSKYYTLRYVLAASLAQGESRIMLPAFSDDSDALFRGCRALGAELTWEDEQESILSIRGVGYPVSAGPVTINVGNAGAVLRLLLGL
jgi:3-phosphoshikimate 1-carboxyvinyltransferase